MIFCSKWFGPFFQQLTCDPVDLSWGNAFEQVMPDVLKNWICCILRGSGTLNRGFEFFFWKWNNRSWSFDNMNLLVFFVLHVYSVSKWSCFSNKMNFLQGRGSFSFFCATNFESSFSSFPEKSQYMKWSLSLSFANPPGTSFKTSISCCFFLIFILRENTYSHNS